MSFTITPDEGDDFNTTYHVRATISTRAEFEELIAKLTKRLEFLTAVAPQGNDHEHDTTARQPVRSGPAIPASTHSCTDCGAQFKEDDFTRSFRGD